MEKKNEQLITKRLVLKAFSECHRSAMLDMFCDKTIKKTYMLPDFENKEQAGPLFDKFVALSNGDERFLYGVFLQDTPIGFINECEKHDTMMERGYVKSIDEAFDIYMGAHGQRLAYVANPLEYVSLEEGVEAILAAGGIPVLAHLYYYLLDAEGERTLVRRFRELAGDRAAMEVHYAAYSQAQREALAAIADEFGLMHSCASDFHGNLEGETLAHGFIRAQCAPLLKALGL